MLRVVIADDHLLMLDALGGHISRDPHLELVGTATDGQEAVRLAKDKNPDVVLMDVSMPVKTGLEATADLHRARPHIHVIVLSALDTEEYALRAFKAGASGYLDKGMSGAELIRAVKQARAGAVVLSPKLIEDLALELADGMSRKERILERFRHSTRVNETSRRILELAAEGKSNEQIAQVLTTDPNTVKTSISRLFKRLGAETRIDLIMRAIRLGVIQPPYASGPQ